MISVNNKPLPPGEVKIERNRILVDGKDYTPAGKFKLSISFDPNGANEIQQDGKVLYRLKPGESIDFMVG